MPLGWVDGRASRFPGATYLTRQVASADAMRIRRTDEPCKAPEALRMNLINEVGPHDQLLSRAEEIARHIASMPPPAVRMMKECMVRCRDLPVTAAWRLQTLMHALLTQRSTDGDEGRRAFLAKRPPLWTVCLLPSWRDRLAFQGGQAQP